MEIIGIDCAVDSRKCGLAMGHLVEEKVTIVETFTQLSGIDLVEKVCARLQNSSPVLLAMDAPLGWPKNLGHSLTPHHAGENVQLDGNTLFRRETDMFIKKTINKQPLDVGADRIARTALAALQFLAAIRSKTQLRIQMAWKPGEIEETSCIEVYPAATLESWGCISRGYKGKKESNVKQRQLLVQRLKAVLEIPEVSFDAMLRSDDILDSVVCVLAGADFVLKNVYEPFDVAAAKKEGWIWVKRFEGTARPQDGRQGK